MKVIDFKLPDQDGKLHKLSDYRGRWVVLYFYPRDDTPGCTKEACGFRDQSRLLIQKNVVVIGVSKDSVKSHKKFADKYNLNFSLLSDESKSTIIAYEAWGKKTFLGRKFEGTLRKTYLISPNGQIKKIYHKVNPLSHSEDVLKDIEIFSKE